MKKQELIEMLKKGRIEDVEMLLSVSRVIELIEKLEEPQEIKLKVEDLDTRTLEDEIVGYLEGGDAELRNYKLLLNSKNEVEIEWVEIDPLWFKKMVQYGIENYMDNLKESYLESK